MAHILIVDDDVDLCEMLSEYLVTEGFTVDTVHDGEQGAHLAVTTTYDLLMLDVMLPTLNGFECLRLIRNKSQIPVLMLTAKGDEVDRIVGLEMGADDYLPKPFNPRELVARLRAILRRSEQNKMTKNEGENVDILYEGTLEINPASRLVLNSGEPVNLTSTEYNLLEVLVRHAGHIVTKEMLSEKAMGRKLTNYDRSIDMHVSKLRRKLDPDSKDKIIIKTIRGMGYQFTGG
jgi:two-component system response regulator CpxR